MMSKCIHLLAHSLPLTSITPLLLSFCHPCLTFTGSFIFLDCKSKAPQDQRQRMYSTFPNIPFFKDCLSYLCGQDVTFTLTKKQW